MTIVIPRFLVGLGVLYGALYLFGPTPVTIMLFVFALCVVAYRTIRFLLWCLSQMFGSKTSPQDAALAAAREAEARQEALMREAVAAEKAAEERRQQFIRDFIEEQKPKVEAAKAARAARLAAEI